MGKETMNDNEKRNARMKIRSTVAVAMTAVLLCALIYAAAAVNISIVPSSQSVAPGENVTVDVYVDPEGSAIAGVDYVLRFNNSLLNATAITPGTFFSGFSTWQFSEINNTLGIVDYGETILGSGSVSTPGSLSIITFQAIALRGIDELFFQTITVSDPDGYPIPAHTSNGTVRIGICGDVNNDGKVTMGDGRLVYLNVIYGNEAYPLANPWAADVNCDEKITMGDGRLVYLSVIYGAEQYPLHCCG